MMIMTKADVLWCYQRGPDGGLAGPRAREFPAGTVLIPGVQAVWWFIPATGEWILPREHALKVVPL